MRDLAAGFGYLRAGLRWTAHRPRLWLFGLIPALITLVIYALVLAALGFYAVDMIRWCTPFAAHWQAPWREIVRVVVGLLLIGAALLVAVVTFTAATLAIGGPFYETVAKRVEESMGVADAQEPGLLRGLVVGTKDAVVMTCYGVVFGVVLFVLGFVPVLGQTVVPVVGVCVSGFFLVVELSGVAAGRHGVSQRTTRRLLRRRRSLALGFGVPLFLLFCVPGFAVVCMPPAVAGATLLHRERLAETT